MFMIYLRSIFCIYSFSGSLVIVIKPKVNVADMLY